ncbi:urease accessory protein UreF [Actinomadura rayongensis]|uniref:Urease accessory protein UreF n=1 Tax=Actinomadura rayongensis TaxID=1429076 RepID=A0A6I4W6D4_9ACTN|nr:urease accessory UreF family protein [Actinomadura rayongensis]MXQ63756.1 urease accessory protein UreF [Actinomadura rayongensis]
MDASLLLLADARLPAGAHAHSGGVEPAVTAGAITDVPTLLAFLHGRLTTSGLVTAALAAAANTHATHELGTRTPDATASNTIAAHTHSGCGRRAAANVAAGAGVGGGWEVLDGEADARTPSPAQRRASRAQGRSLLRAVRAAWPSPVLDALVPLGPHHPVVLGAATAVAGGGPREAASVAVFGTVSGGASAAVRLLGLDPLAVHAALAGLADVMDAVAAEAAGYAGRPWAELPAASAPVLDLDAERHARANLRLFES